MRPRMDTAVTAWAYARQHGSDIPLATVLHDIHIMARKVRYNGADAQARIARMIEGPRVDGAAFERLMRGATVTRKDGME